MVPGLNYCMSTKQADMTAGLRNCCCEASVLFAPMFRKEGRFAQVEQGLNGSKHVKNICVCTDGKGKQKNEETVAITPRLILLGDKRFDQYQIRTVRYGPV